MILFDISPLFIEVSRVFVGFFRCQKYTGYIQANYFLGFVAILKFTSRLTVFIAPRFPLYSVF